MRYAAACLLMAWSVALSAQPLPGVALTGSTFTYRVQAGDTLTRIGARYGVDPYLILKENGLQESRPLKIGRVLRIDNRHIVPASVEDGIVINLPQRMLFRMQGGQPDKAYPVGVGRPDWPTATGDFTLVSREEGKTWFVPLSIQQEMERQGEEVRAQIPPGPENPLGKYWMGLSLPALGIHGTIAPESVYHFQSHGCIRLHPDDAAEMFATTNKGDPGTIIYQPVLLYRAPDNKIHLEVHRDIYRKGIDAYGLIRKLAATARVDDTIDWKKAAQAITAHDGVARDVTLAADKESP